MRSGNIIEYFVRLASFFHLQHRRTFINTHIHIYGYLCYCYLLLVFFMSRALEERTAYTKEETILDIKVDILRISKNHRMSRIMSSTINSVGVDRMDQIWAERYLLFTKCWWTWRGWWRREPARPAPGSRRSAATPSSHLSCSSSYQLEF